jgi:hypothetical protein
MAWAFAFGSILVVMAVGFIAQKIGLGNVIGLGLDVAIFGVAGYLAVYMTKASKGQGIVAFLVSSLVLAVASYAAVSFIFSTATHELTTTTGALAGANAADTAKFAQAAGGLMGGFFGVIIAVVMLLVSFISGMVGCLTGGSAKNKALGSSSIQPRLAA